MGILNAEGARNTFGHNGSSGEEMQGVPTTDQVAQRLVELRVVQYAREQAICRDRVRQNPNPGFCVNCGLQIEKRRQETAILCNRCQKLEDQSRICSENLLFILQMQANSRKKKPP